MSKIEIVTENKVRKSFKGVDCYVERIIDIIQKKGSKETYFVKTFLVNEDEGVRELIGEMQPYYVFDDEVDDLFKLTSVTLGESKLDFDLSCRRQLLLTLTKQSEVYGIDANEWKIKE